MPDQKSETSDLEHHPDKKSTIVTSEIREKKRSSLFALSLMLFMSIYTIGTSFAGVFILNELAPFFVSQGLTEVAATSLKNTCAGIGALAFLVSVIVGGSISDDIRSRFGNRLPMVLLGGTIAGLTHIIAPVILNEETLILAPLVYIINNIGMGIAYSPLLALLSELFTKEERVWGGMVIAAIAIIGIASAYSIFPGLGANYTQKWMLTGAVLIICAFITFLLTPKTNPDFPPDETIADILKTPVYLFKLGGGRNFIIMFIVQALWGAGLYTITLNMNDFLKSTLDPVTEVPIIVFMVGIGGAIFAVPVGIMINKVGKTKGALIGTFILALYVMMLAVFDQFWPFFVIAVIGGIGTIIVQTVSVALPADIVPEGKEGQFMGIFTFASSFPSPIMAIMSGIIIESSGYSSLFYTVVIILVVAGFLLLGLNYEKMIDSEYNQWYKRYLEFRGLVVDTVEKSKAKIDSSTDLLKSKMMKDSL